jgi:ZIP family zinc transporter
MFLMMDVVERIGGYLMHMSGGNILLAALYAGLFVAIMTSLGSFIAIFAHKMPEWGLDVSLSFAAGVMIVASFTSLILPGIEITGSFTPVAMGIFLGILLIFLMDKGIPHEHRVAGYEGPEKFREKLRMMWLIIFAVIIHNLPEGLAIGTTMVYDLHLGIITAIAIGIQDIPEGAVVSLPLALMQKKRLRPIALGVMSGVAEMMMVLMGAIFFNHFNFLLPYGMGLAGGAMLYVTVKEMIPEIYERREHELLITLGFFLGFYIMLFLDSVMG